MIFKSEGEPNIKKITAETQEVDRESKPLDYKTDITKEQIVSVQTVYFKDAVERGDWKNFAEYGRLLQNLNIPIPSLTKADRNRIRTKMNQDLLRLPHDVTAGDIFTHGKRFSHLMQFDPAYLDLLHNDGRRRFSEIKAEWEKRPAIQVYGWAFFAHAHVLNPHTSIRPPKDLIDALQDTGQDIMESKGNWVNVLHKIRNLAEARMCGVEIPSLNQEEWRMIREKAYEAQRDATVHLFSFMFYARIINAESVTVDEQGLHIVDPAPVVPLSIAKPRPSPKHI